jgi:hypothetical protein
VLTAILAIVVVMLATALGYEAYMRRQDLRVFRSLLAEESADRIASVRQLDATAGALINRLQLHAISVEKTIADTQCALMWTAWRLAERGVLDGDDVPGDDTVDVEH